MRSMTTFRTESIAPARTSAAHPLLPKLRIGPVDDPLEREADRIADAVVAGGGAAIAGIAPPDRPQRKCAGCEAEEEQTLRRAADSAASQHGAPVVDSARIAVASGGAPLTADQQSYFEPRFGRDLGNVRLHTHARAASPIIQRKIRVGPVDDPLEREADGIADAEMAGRPIGPITGAPPGATQRKCKECEEEEKLQRKPSATSGPAAGEAPPIVHEVLRSPGQPLDAASRAYFEPRFGRDLSRVRLHTHDRAAAAAAGIRARAYTLQNDIAFAAGEFSPETLEGRRLIAHELAHVAQQVPYIARQAAPFHSRTFRDDEGGDALDYTETVQVAPTQTGAGLEGSVDRSVSAPASGTLPRQLVHTGRVNHIRLTPDCKIVVPLGIQFQQLQASASPGICQSPPNATPVNLLPAAQFQNIQNQYVNALNGGLNNRFAARVSGCRQAQPCTGQAIPIVIAAQLVTNNPDITISVVNRGGRSDAATICAGSFRPELPVHEGGHQALGAADEYRETNPLIIAAANAAGLHWERRERERGDLSAMEDEYSYGRFTMFHERHFRFAQVFLEAVLQGQGCSVTLDRVASSPWEFRADLGFGGASTGRGGLPYGSLFLGAGIPLEPRRRLMFLFGAQGQVFDSLDFRPGALLALWRGGREPQPAERHVQRRLAGARRRRGRGGARILQRSERHELVAARSHRRHQPMMPGSAGRHGMRIAESLAAAVSRAAER